MLTDEQFNRIFPFDQPRKFQRTIIENIIQAFEISDFVLLQAPTGIGKSVIASAISNYFNTSYILTSQKTLQEQYFRDLQIPYVQGRNNYICRKNSKLTCDMGICKLMTKNDALNYTCKDCPYVIARDYTYKSNVSNLNYSYFVSMISSNNTLQTPRDLIVLDECHNVENELINTCTLKLSKKDLSYHEILMSFPKQQDTPKQKLKWLNTVCADTLFNHLYKLQSTLDAYESNQKNKFYFKTIKDVSFITELLKRLEVVGKQHENNIIIQQINDDEIQFKLLYGDQLFQQYILKLGTKFLAMSATVFDKDLFCKNLGLNTDDVVFINCPSVFPKENRPIYVQPVGKMTYKEKEQTYPKLLKKVKDILNTHYNEKGIIHTVNYEIAEYLYTNLNDPRLILPRGKERAEKLDLFLNSDVNEPYVLISPSLTEGIDLKEDLSRFCIICKVPYLNIKDTWVEKRMNDNYDWYINNVVETILQMTGRSIRSETDYAKSYILDQSFEQFMYFNENRFPKWWIKSIIR